jgi:hypothetical protein
MEVDRFKHRQLAPTMGPSSRSSREFEGLLFKIKLPQQLHQHSSSSSNRGGINIEFDPVSDPKVVDPAHEKATASSF